MGIGNLPIHDGIFDAIFYCAVERAGGDVKNIHDLFSADWIFPVTDLVFFFDLLNSFFYMLEVLDNVAEVSDNLWLRWAAILHDIAKTPH